MPKFPPDQKIVKQGKKKDLPKANKGVYDKTPRAKFQDPQFPTSEGDLGVLRVNPAAIPKMVKAPTRTGDSLTNHVGAVGNAMKRAGFKL